MPAPPHPSDSPSMSPTPVSASGGLPSRISTSFEDECWNRESDPYVSSRSTASLCGAVAGAMAEKPPKNADQGTPRRESAPNERRNGVGSLVDPRALGDTHEHPHNRHPRPRPCHRPCADHLRPLIWCANAPISRISRRFARRSGGSYHARIEAEQRRATLGGSKA